jgi:hypothetical protein
VHIRQYWNNLQEALADDDNYLGHPLSEFKNKPLSVTQAVAFTSSLSQYSDDLPGVAYPQRPSLDTFTRGDMKVRYDAGIGLRYGDGRDKGFILSCQQSSDDTMESAKDCTWPSMSFVQGVLNNLHSAVFCFSEDTE